MDARPVLAALAHDAAREVYAAIVLGAVEDSRVEPAKRRRAIETLVSAGLIVRRGDDLVADGGVFRALLSEDAPTGRPPRFLDADGRITRVPRGDAERRDLFARVIDRIISPDEVLDEPTVSARIGALHDDVTSLRRDLVDAGFLDRATDGSAYRRGDGSGPGR